MNRNRRVIALVILIVGFLLLAAAGVVFLRNLNQPPAETTGVTPPAETITEDGEVVAISTVPAVATSDLIEVVISIQTLPRGYRITGEELEVDLRLASQVGPDVITRREDAVGLFVRTDVFQGTTLTRNMLAPDLTAAGEEDFGPSSLIPFGSLAIAIPMDRLSSVAYGLKPGDSVDILFSFAFSEIDEQFRTLLRNSVTFYLEVTDEEGNSTRSVYVIDPYGRFENLPTNDLAHIAPGEEQRPLPISFMLQNAKVIHVGPWKPPEPPQPPTPTVDPNAPTPTPGGPPPTPTPSPPDVLLVALPPQQQLLLKYAVENRADIDFALRAPGDGQINNIVNVDLTYLLERFNIEIPPDSRYIINTDAFAPSAPGGQTETGDGTDAGANE